MARTYLIFGDIEGKLDVLRVECTRCERKGRYSVAGLIEKHGREGHMMKWREQLNGDCPKRDAPQMHNRRDLICLICQGRYKWRPRFILCRPGSVSEKRGRKAYSRHRYARGEIGGLDPRPEFLSSAIASRWLCHVALIAYRHLPCAKRAWILS
jgi:hypothetical protein